MRLPAGPINCYDTTTMQRIIRISGKTLLTIRNISIVILALFILCPEGKLKAQTAELGLSLGLTNYQGDLPSYNFEDGFRILIHPEVGIFGRYFVRPSVAVKADLRITGVSGDDELHSRPSGQRRNLDFRSRILQAYLTAEFYPLTLFYDEPTRFSIFLQAGAGVMRFNPEARYMDEWVELHPLHTEGQGLEQFPDQDPYHLTQIHIPVGGGIRYQINDNLSIGGELTFFFLFTDYLDDVSTIYISYPELLEAEGPLTAALSNRVGEYLGTEPVIAPTGTSRGNPDYNDLFGTGSITIQYAFDAIFVPNSKKFKNRCPKF